MTRRVFYDRRGAVTFPDWRQWAQDQELRIEDLARRVEAALDQEAACEGSHQVVVASHKAVGGNLTIDFKRGRSVLLILDQSITLLTFVPPEVNTGRSVAVNVFILQGPGAPYTIAGYSGAVFFRADGSNPNGTPPDLSETAGWVDVIASMYAEKDPQLRFMWTPGAPT